LSVPSFPPSLPPTDEEIEFLFSSTDKDANQMIDFKEVRREGGREEGF